MDLISTLIELNDLWLFLISCACLYW